MKPSEIILEPNSKKIQLDKFSKSGWDFFVHKENMLNSVDLDKLLVNLKVKHLPEIFFGYNRFYFANKEKNFVYEFSPLNMINLASFDTRNSQFSSKEIYYNPEDVKVQYHDTWKNIKVDRDDIMKLDPVEDWSYSSPYMGNFSSIPKSQIANLYSVNNDKTFNVVNTNMTLPVNRLGQNNPIIEYCELTFYEDELNDNGLCESKLRFRIMNDCFFGLLRCYLRVDNVIIRNIDTRIFHSFGDNYIYRNFNVKQVTYDQLNKKGFNVNSNWSLSPNQSDIISQQMGDPIFNISDQIMLG